MLVVDASCLYVTLTGAPGAAATRARLAGDDDHVAPHIVDVEVFGVIRREFLGGRLDRTEATQAVEDLEDWPGERYGHRPLLNRAWKLRDTVRGWDAMYVALAEGARCDPGHRRRQARRGAGPDLPNRAPRLTKGPQAARRLL